MTQQEEINLENWRQEKLERENNKHFIQTNKNIIVIYHGDCHDGFGGAWVAHKVFVDRAFYFAIDNDYHNMSPEFLSEDGVLLNEEQMKEKEIYIIDYSYTKNVLQDLEKKVKKLIVLDHHISNKEAVESISDGIFNNEISGAILAYNYFFPGKDIPNFIKLLDEADRSFDHIQDENTLLRVRFILSKKLDFKIFNELENIFKNEESLDSIKICDDTSEDYLEKLLAFFDDKVDFVEFEGLILPAVNATLAKNKRSLLGKRLYQKYPPLVMMYQYQNFQWHFVLRSDTDNSNINCSDLAEKYGGGGHKGAAEFTINSTDGNFPFKFIKQNNN